MWRKSKIKFPKLSFPEKKQLFEFFDIHILPNTPLTLCVSWGTDSMLLASSVIDYFQQTWQDLSTISILHINHKTRPETDNEEIFIHHYFGELKVVCFVYTWTKKTEAALREVRQEFIEKHLSITKSTYLDKPKNKIRWQQIVILWHNLTDRIETSLLHMTRWAGIKWVQNMKAAEIVTTKKWKEYLLLRPLLAIPKDRISKICEENNIPHMQDNSNFDSTVSKRNKLRHEILPELIKLGGKESGESFWNSWKLLYEFLDAQSQGIMPTFYNLSWSVYRWDYTTYCRFDLPKSIYETIYLLKELDISQQGSGTFLQIFYKFLTTWKQWHIKFNNYYFFIAHKKLYVIWHPQEFWKIENKKERQIDKLGNYNLGDFVWCISNKELIGGVIRFPREGDRRKGKRVKKRLLNKKIPNFRRNFIPVIEKKGEIIAVLPLEQLTGYY